MKMPYHLYSHLKESMTRAKAKNQLSELKLYTFTKLKKDKREKIHKNLSLLATSKEEMAKRAVKVEDLKGLEVSIEDIIKAKNGRKTYD